MLVTYYLQIIAGQCVFTWGPQAIYMFLNKRFGGITDHERGPVSVFVFFNSSLVIYWYVGGLICKFSCVSILTAPRVTAYEL